MEQLDLKDMKILYQLSSNCRQSNTKIGKLVGLSKQVVDYRIKRMEDENIITGYQTVINSYKLDYDVYRYYVTFQNTTQKIKDEMINFLILYKNMWHVYSASGLFDLGVLIWVKNLENFNYFGRNLTIHMEIIYQIKSILFFFTLILIIIHIYYQIIMINPRGKSLFKLDPNQLLKLIS